MSAGLTAAGKQRLHEVAQRYAGDGRDGGDHQVPGLVALAARGDDVHVEALGTMSVGGAPVTRDAIFRISSDTKPITAAATLALAAEGRLDLGEPVDRLLPELAGRRVLRRMDGPLDDTVPAHRAITVRDLLTFTFGFGIAAEMFAAAEPWPVVEAATARHVETFGPPDRDAQPDPDTWMAGLGSLPLLAQPGSAGSTTQRRRCWACWSRGPPGSRSATCCGPGSSSRSACGTPGCGRRGPAG